MKSTTEFHLTKIASTEGQETLEKLGEIIFYQAAKTNEADDALLAVEYLEKVGFFNSEEK